MTRATPYPIIAASRVQTRPDATLMHCIEMLNTLDAKIVVITDQDGRIMGTLTDGDVRRGLLKGCTLESPVKNAMHTDPHIMPTGSSRKALIDAMQIAQVKQILLATPEGKLAGVVTYDAISGFERARGTNPVVIMAGGKGSRLLPFTRDIPKPLVEVRGKPLLAHIIEQFVGQGFGQFYIAVNHMAPAIEAYFGNGKKWNCQIDYVREEQFLGTAGALSLLSPQTQPIIVINSDILSSVDFADILDFHFASRAMATVCSRSYRVEVPYGVIDIEDNALASITEKPTLTYQVNAGIYVLEPEALRFIPPNIPSDMPDILQRLSEDGHRVSVFPMHESWADIGTEDDLLQASTL